jgi:uncharacterized protein (DUF1800 family)
LRGKNYGPFRSGLRSDQWLSRRPFPATGAQFVQIQPILRIMTPTSVTRVRTPFQFHLPRFFRTLAIAGLVLLGACGMVRAAIDANVTKQIWKLKFGVSDAQLADSYWLEQDSDGDGIKNKDEIAAGTNPFLASSMIKVSSIVKVGSNVNVSFPTVDRKHYRVESTTTLAVPGSWAGVGAHVTGDGNAAMVSVPYAANTFYRVRVDEQLDTDGDGVSDWAELAVTLNPTLTETVPGTNDHDYVVAQLALSSTPTITAALPFASEDGPTAGKFTITRAQNLFAGTVNYEFSGTGVRGAGADYVATDKDGFPANGVVAFAAHGPTTFDIFVNPVPQATVKGSRSVTVALVEPPAGGGGAPPPASGASGATVIINPSTVPGGTGLLARYYDYAFVQIAGYIYNKNYYGTPNAGNIVVTPSGAVSVQVGQVIPMKFTSGNLNDPLYSNKNYTVTAVNSGFFTLGITGTSLPANSSGNCEFTISAAPASAKITRVDPTVDNNWLAGSPDPLIGADNFSVSWTGQVQPEFSEEYTFVVQADDGCKMSVNGQVQEFKTLPATNFGGSTYTYDSATGDTVVNYSSSVIKPGSFVVGENVRLDPGSGNLTHAGGSTYTYDGGTGLAVINYSNLTNVTPGGFAVGQTVELDPTAGTLSPYGQLPYVITAATTNTFTVDFGTGIYGTQSGSAAINISDNLNRVITAVTSDTFTVNFGPGKYANGSTGVMNMDIINKPLKDFSSMSNERYFRMPMISGVRYDIQLDYYESTGNARCQLYWFSPSLPKQIIPAQRLYPAYDPVATPQATLAPAAHITPTSAIALVGGAFSIPIAGSNGASVTLSGNPAWLTYNAITHSLTGTPPGGAAGDYQIVITITNATGTSTSVLNLHVDQNAGTVVREYWSGVAGTTVASIPTGTTPTGSANLTSLAAPTDFGDNYGARIRCYITAPTTGNYYFWIAGNNAAELWISNDDEPINAFKRAWVNAGSATPQAWNVEADQKSPWLALEQGKKYYVEILHKAGVGVGDNLAVGWLKPGESGATPSEVVPGYALSPYVPPAPGSTPGTLYVATMLAQGTAVSSGVGGSTLRLSEDENTAIMTFSASGLTGPVTSKHIHTDPYLAKPSTIVYDIDTPANPGDGLQPDGSYLWTILPVGTLSKADIIEIIKQGKAYINLHTAAYPSGEIRGNYTLANGSRTFTPPPAPPAWTDDHTTDVGAIRFLQQASFGANIADIAALKAMASYEAWIDDQFTKPASLQLAEVFRTEGASAQGGNFDESLTFNAWWWNSIAGADQLRQRIAFALSQIHVVSGQGPLADNAPALSYFYDKLAQGVETSPGSGIYKGGAFGNFRDILDITTLTPSMGRYLDMLRNDKPDLTVGRIPNENYAREIKQLFSIGLYRMWPDGTLMLTSKDQPIDTYTQREIVGLAHVFTGWDYGYDGGVRNSFSAAADWTRQMRVVPARHFTGPKRLLNNEVLPGIATLGGQPLDPYATHNSAAYYDPAYVALPDQELEAAHDLLFNHPNVGPFICRQLIQRLVTSNPSRDYLYRVVQKFNNNGSGVRGDMRAVIKAILLDYEARSSTLVTVPAFGKQREPLLRIAAAARAFRPSGFTGGTYSQTGTTTITITANGHNLANGNTVFLDFTSGSPAPWIGAYTVGGATTNTFTVTATGWVTGTYSQTAGSNVMTITMGSHWLEAGQKAYFDFTSATTGTLPADGVYTAVTSTSVGRTAGTTFTITAPDTTARSGNVMIPRFSPGSYTIGSSGLAAPFDRRGTMDTNFDHHLNVGDQVQLNFYGTNGGSVQPNDMVVTVESVPDLNTWTFLATGNNLQSNQGYNEVFQFPLKSLPLNRSGSVGSRPSTFNMGNTDATLNQSPINSPTVFNYFLPDFKNPGALASQGITTPEFQTTAETTVVRQSQFLYDGVFNPGTTNGYSSFINGGNALVMDLSKWMGLATTDGLGAGPQPTQAWTSNANLPTLISHMNTLLAAGQLSSTATTTILNFIGRQVTSITTGSPCTFNMGTAHGLQVGDSVTVTGITGGTWSGASTTGNGTFFVTAVPTTSSFRLATATTGGTNLNCTSTTTNGGLNLTNSTAGIIAYTNSAPTTTNTRDRVRAIIHLILTSPDFTIQR